MKKVIRVKKVRSKKKFDVLFPQHVPSANETTLESSLQPEIETGLVLKENLVTASTPVPPVKSRNGRCTYQK